MSASHDSALKYSKIKWNVFPVFGVDDAGNCLCGDSRCEHAGKHPQTQNGLKNATANESEINELFKNKAGCNIGIVTGKGSGFFGLDIDAPKGGMISIEELETQFGKLPKTVAVTTGHDDSEHRYFCYPSEGIKNRVGVRPGVDVRGDGGYLIAPPSRHKSGRLYAWKKGCSPDEVEMAIAPSWLLNVLTSQAPKNVPSVDQETFPDGTRNDNLFSYCMSLAQRGVDHNAVVAAVHAKNKSACKPPLSNDEVEQILQSLQRYPTQVNDALVWEKINDLPTLETKVPSLGVELIPEPLRDWAMDVSERMQTSVEMVMIPVIVSLSGLIGRRLAIKPKKRDNWKIIPNLWGAIIAPPSAMKTPAMNEGLKFLRKLEVEAKNKFDFETVTYEMLENESDESIPTPVRKRFLLSDATTEKVGMLLNENPDGLTLFRDELLGFFMSLEKPSREGDRQFYLEAFNGDGYFVYDRVGRGTLDIPALCISILGGIQPDRLSSYFTETIQNGLSDDGFLTRFQLMVYPPKLENWRMVDRDPNYEAHERVGNVFAKLVDFNFKAEVFEQDRYDQTPCLRFDDNAQKLFYSWYEHLEKRLRSEEIESGAFEAHLTKYRKLMPALSLIFHVIELCDTSKEGFNKTQVGVENTRKAIQWCEFLEFHARKVYADANRPQLKTVHLLADKIKKNKIKDGETVRNIIRHGWSGLTDAKLVRAALSVLQSLNWIKVLEVSPKGIGAPSEIVRLNPELIKGFSNERH